MTPPLYVWLANIGGWPAIHLILAKIFLTIPLHRFRADNFITAPQPWEQNGRLYRNVLSIHKWKALLPDGAPWLGGSSKRHLASNDRTALESFCSETRRAELAHWAMLACTPVFFLWNPPWACGVMLLYGLAANLPCILAQRYNRLVLMRRLAVPAARLQPSPRRAESPTSLHP
jgi:glycosyl-4,4'-diaponeurosporenoate acyltransferase